jgi:hypothetical protein
MAKYQPYFTAVDGDFSHLKDEQFKVDSVEALSLLGCYKTLRGQVCAMSHTAADAWYKKKHSEKKEHNDDLVSTIFKVFVQKDEKDEESAPKVSFTNPIYWGAAWAMPFGDDEEKVFKTVENDLKTVVKNNAKNESDVKFQGFGHNGGGWDIYNLQWYRYMFGMHRRTDQTQLAKFKDHTEAVRTIDARLKDLGCFVFSKTVDDTTVFGAALKAHEDPQAKYHYSSEKYFLPTIDYEKLSHGAAMPYEIIVKGDTAWATHARFRLAVSWPSLTMATFTQIIATPGAIEGVMQDLFVKPVEPEK